MKRTVMPKHKPILKSHKEHRRVPFESIALFLQGGGALGAYQAGVYQALAEAKLEPDWVAGVSIGAINSAIIAGNPPEKRVDKLREFWESITTNTMWDTVSEWESTLVKGDASRAIMNKTSASVTLVSGVPGFFKPRFPVPWLHESGTTGATSYYDTTPLKATLERLIDFDRINSGKIRLSIGAVNVRTGNFVYFDTQTHVISPDHVMASGALPPGFPAIAIDGEYYWDGGLISNTPLQWVLDNRLERDTLAFQVDLWSASGDLPSNMAEVMTREKEIMYSSRTRAAIDKFKYSQRMRNALAGLMGKLPKELKKDKDAQLLATAAGQKVCNIALLIYHAHNYEGDSKDYEFSRLSMEDHWKEGYSATVRTLRHPEVLERPTNQEGVFVFDVSEQGRE
jgi:NTE family protein